VVLIGNVLDGWQRSTSFCGCAITKELALF